MGIRRLPERIINLIAAGETIERPTSVVKELIENAIDAGSNAITITFDNGGKDLIAISDDGYGIKDSEIELAFERHATSKVDDDNIFTPSFLGFRGEALPSIASIAEIGVETSHQNIAYKYKFTNGKLTSKEPHNRQIGTKISVYNIFSSIPVRLKFLKSNKAEIAACIDLVNRIAICYWQLKFVLIIDNKTVLNFNKAESLSQRIEQVIGQEFALNSTAINYKDSKIEIKGYIGIPTFNKATSQNIYIFINDRIIKDKNIALVIRNSYQNLIPHTRYPMAILFLYLEPKSIDVNVHPTKQEVRFVDEAGLKSTIFNVIREALKEVGHKTSSSIQETAISHFSLPSKPSTSVNAINTFLSEIQNIKPLYNDNYKESFLEEPSAPFNYKIVNSPPIPAKQEKLIEDSHQFLGEARCQIGFTYIVAEDDENIIIVDQHAAHERLNLEKYKNIILNDNSKHPAQALTIPLIISIEPAKIDLLLEKSENLKQFGFLIERHGYNEIAIREINSRLSTSESKKLIVDLADLISEATDIAVIENFFLEKFANVACKASIKAGQQLSLEEMNSLLRAMENTHNSAQCNHGRPTYIKISKKKVDSLFERS